MHTLNKKVALITGAGSGIGKAIAALFAHEGASVVLADIHQDNIETVAADIIVSGRLASCFSADVSIEKEVDLLMDHILKTYQKLDILVNNAGVMDNFTPVADVSTDLWNRVMGVNLNGPFYTCRKAVNLFLKQGSGNIINISSIGGLCGGRAGAAYTASKHALIGLTKNIGYSMRKKTSVVMPLRLAASIPTLYREWKTIHSDSIA